LESELKLVKEELLATQQEGELLKLKLINQNQSYDANEVEEDNQTSGGSFISNPTGLT
jgi:hypothetical protein